VVAKALTRKKIVQVSNLMINELKLTEKDLNFGCDNIH